MKRYRFIGTIIKESSSGNSNACCEDPGFQSYIKRNGRHFTNQLAVYASSLMKNSDGSSHSWNAAAVREASKKSAEALDNFPPKATLGDLTYLANMAYADFCPDLLTEAQCIDFALHTAMDIDGYEGMIFNRWLSDVMGQDLQIPWSDF